ncbi:MAG: CHAT domain-containing protein, partial [Caldilinea sp.]
MSSRTLADLDISVTRSPAGYVATMRTPDGRRAQTTFETPFEEFQLKYYIAAVTRGPQPARRSSQTGADTVARELGSALFGAMFSGAALQQLDATLDTLALSRQQGVRLRIDLSGAPELAGLPWEFLYHPERNFFLALSPDLTIVRYVQTPEPVRTLHVDPPLRILAMACSPRDLDPLDIARERENLQASLERLTTARMVEIDWAPANTLHSVTAMLDQRDYHIFHFMGHGVSMQEEGRTAGYLLFEDAGGAAAPVSAERLGQAFRRSVRLALINACEGAVGDLHNPSAGVATSLLTQGVPAVVAMQFSISDAIAIPFAGEFYSAIAIGLPVDAAMTSARRNVWARFDDSGEWATPVLFLRSPDGHIFDVGAFAGGDVQTSALQQEVIAATMDNLDVDLTQLRTILSTSSREVLKRLPGWLTDRWSSVDRSAEELYQQAVEHMHTERWTDANRFFKLCNDRSPGYRDIVALWQQSKLQERLAEHYRRLVSAYAEQKWQRVMELAAAILAEAPSYKDTLALYNRSVQMLGMMPRPSGLPSSSPDKPLPPQTRPSSA